MSREQKEKLVLSYNINLRAEDHCGSMSAPILIFGTFLNKHPATNIPKNNNFENKPFINALINCCYNSNTN